MLKFKPGTVEINEIINHISIYIYRSSGRNKTHVYCDAGGRMYVADTSKSKNDFVLNSNGNLFNSHAYLIHSCR